MTPPSVPTIIADPINDNTNIVDAGASCYGGLVKGKGGKWEEYRDRTIPMLHWLEVCVPLLRLRHSFLILMARRMADSAGIFYLGTYDTQRRAPIRAPYPIRTNSAYH